MTDRELRGGEFNRATSVDSGAQGVGARLRLTPVDPYQGAAEISAPTVERITAGDRLSTWEKISAASCNSLTANATARARLAG